jgi:putative ABC transport system substrate-binding protein
MNRRDFIASVGAATAAWPIRAGAQSASKPVVGMLFLSNPEPDASRIRAAFARLGYREGENIQYEVRVAESSSARLSAMAVELVARNVDVIMAATTPAVAAAKAATSNIPIIMAVAADPLGSGFVASLSRPGGNITGISAAVAETAGAILGLLREAIPTASRIGLIVNSADPFHLRLIEGVEAANLGVKVDLRIFRIPRPEELENTFEQIAAQKIDAAVVQPTLPRQAVVALASRHKLPTGLPAPGYAHLGGFISYSGRGTEMAAVAAAQVDQILRGARPADIPVRQPTRFELVLNLKTARAFNLAVSPLLLAQADEVIE